MDMKTSESFIRTAMLLGAESESRLLNAKVAVYGAGGVGGHCIEALARSGVGKLHIVDNDTVSESNFNRQCAATKSFLGHLKTESMKARVNEVSNAAVTTAEIFVLPNNIESAVPPDTDFIVDAIDTVSAKIALIQYANEHNIPIISCVGMGNRLDPTEVRLGDISEVCGCPLARTLRRELKKKNILHLPVVYSREEPHAPLITVVNEHSARPVPGSCAFVPAAAGLALASYAVRVLCGK